MTVLRASLLVACRPARNKSPEHSLPCVLSPEQATLVLRRDVADVFLGPPRHDAKEQSKNNQPIPAAGIRTSAWDGVDGRPPEAQGAVRCTNSFGHARVCP